MQISKDKYTQEIKSKLDKNFLSPVFIRYANMLYLGEEYEECISVCKTGLAIFPYYLTAKLILLKAFLKAEYLNEAEALFNEIKNKIPGKEMIAKLESNIHNLKAISGQEKIYYTKSVKSRYEYKTFEKNFHFQENMFLTYNLSDLLESKPEKDIVNEKKFFEFRNRFDTFHFDKTVSVNSDLRQRKKENASETESSELLSKIKIVTETLADIYAGQGNYKEAFEAYKILIRAGSKNKGRIEEKLYELERSMLRNDNI
ncbi:MAG: hypothetical protein JST15_13155 [Bacteroidetes bacterium]|nr:hypothetical protein [Bacteroidota bacterium]